MEPSPQSKSDVRQTRQVSRIRIPLCERFAKLAPPAYHLITEPTEFRVITPMTTEELKGAQKSVSSDGSAMKMNVRDKHTSSSLTSSVPPERKRVRKDKDFGSQPKKNHSYKHHSNRPRTADGISSESSSHSMMKRKKRKIEDVRSEERRIRDRDSSKNRRMRDESVDNNGSVPSHKRRRTEHRNNEPQRRKSRQDSTPKRLTSSGLSIEERPKESNQSQKLTNSHSESDKNKSSVGRSQSDRDIITRHKPTQSKTKKNGNDRRGGENNADSKSKQRVLEITTRSRTR